MPDSHPPRGSAPHDWRDALSALPLETPPEDGWARLSSRLPTPSPTSTSHGVGRNTRMRRLGWLASAAVLAVAVTVPLQRLHDADPATVPPDSRPDQSSAIASLDPAASIQPATNPSQPAPPDGAVATNPAPGTSTASAGEADASGTPGVMPASPRARESDPPPVTQASPASNGARTTAALDPDDVGDSDLERLHAESARLEALVALARDNDVGNAAAMVLATGLDDRLGAIDAALSQSPLTPTERNRLWRTRVDTLRELAGVETTQRWLATQGQPFDSGLVLVN